MRRQWKLHEYSAFLETISLTSTKLNVDIKQEKNVNVNDEFRGRVKWFDLQDPSFEVDDIISILKGSQ